MPVIKSKAASGYAGTFEYTSGNYKASGNFSTNKDDDIVSISGSVVDVSNNNAMVMRFSDSFSDPDIASTLMSLTKSALDAIVSEL